MAAMGQPGMYQMGNPTGLPTGGMIIAKTEQKSWNFGISWKIVGTKPWVENIGKSTGSG
jgi:hypothetical protein